MLLLLQRLSRLIVISICLFTAGVSCSQIDGEKKSPPNPPANQTAQSSIQPHMMNPMMMGQMGHMNGMMNPHMYLNMMGQMSGMMSPMMMNRGTGRPMNMMYPMMGQMMPGGMVMPGMGAHSNNPMSQMPSAQMMNPKQYEQWFNQMTENMKNMTQQTPATN